MALMRSDPLRWQVGGGWTLEIETFLGPVKWHRAVRQVPFSAQKGPKFTALWGQCSKFFLPHSPPPPHTPLRSINHSILSAESLSKAMLLTVRYLNPQVERMPAAEPMMTAPTGVMIMSAHAPTATPPASVAFWMCSMQNFLFESTAPDPKMLETLF